MFCVHQPLFFPPMFMMERFARCRAIVLIPEVQFSKGTTQSRVKLMSKAGPLLFSIPVMWGDNRSIAAMEIVCVGRVIKKFRKTIQSLYGKSPWYQEIEESFFQFLDVLGMYAFWYLGDLTEATMVWCFSVLQMSVRIYKSNMLKMPRGISKNGRLIQFSRKLRDSVYLCGGAAYKQYMDLERFQAAGVVVQVQQYVQKPYYSNGRLVLDGRISVLDSLFVNGIVGTQALLRI